MVERPSPRSVLAYNDSVGSRTGRSLSALSGAGRGKSELRRAVCRITSGRAVGGPSFAFFAKGGLSTVRRKVPQKIYRPAVLVSSRTLKTTDENGGVRVKRCGKSAPPRQRCSGHGKPHTEQDQIGRESRRFGRSGSSEKRTCGTGGTRTGSARQTSG
jgi:hypothetical protein